MNEFEDFVKARTPALLRYAHVLSGDHAQAEDLVQGALATTYVHWDRIRGSSPDAYVRKAILNAHLSRWRKFTRREQLTSIPPERAGTPVHDVIDDRDAVWRALATLPSRQRAVLVLRYFEDMSEKATAQALGVRIGTVKSQASKALRTLRDLDELREGVSHEAR